MVKSGSFQDDFLYELCVYTLFTCGHIINIYYTATCNNDYPTDIIYITF